jgi:hypothetical protein
MNPACHDRVFQSPDLDRMDITKAEWGDPLMLCKGADNVMLGLAAIKDRAAALQPPSRNSSTGASSSGNANSGNASSGSSSSSTGGGGDGNSGSSRNPHSVSVPVSPVSPVSPGSTTDLDDALIARQHAVDEEDVRVESATSSEAETRSRSNSLSKSLSPLAAAGPGPLPGGWGGGVRAGVSGASDDDAPSLEHATEEVEMLKQHLHQLSVGGLRTLVFGRRQLTRHEWDAWEKQLKEALATSTVDGERMEDAKAVNLKMVRCVLAYIALALPPVWCGTAG